MIVSVESETKFGNNTVIFHLVIVDLWQINLFKNLIRKLLLFQIFYSIDILEILTYWLLILKVTSQIYAWMQEILEARERAKSHIWTFRTVEEASSNWNEHYGHLEWTTKYATIYY